MVIGEKCQFCLKLVIIGDASVGKTNLLGRFDRNQFTYDAIPTIGVEFAIKTMIVRDVKIKAQMWDTAGQQRFKAITMSYYKGACGAMVVFDLTRRSTFENLARWMKELQDYISDEFSLILIGNKCDKVDSREVQFEEAMQFAGKFKMNYLETSALDNVNVELAFLSFIEQIVDIKLQKQLVQQALREKQYAQQGYLKESTLPNNFNLKRQTAKSNEQQIRKSRRKCC